METPPTVERSFGPPPRPAWRALERDGLLLLADAHLPSVVRLVAGGPVRGSWWGHPRGRAIWRASMALSHHPDALELPLLAGKVTYVHRRLWPQVRAVGSAREAWQMKGLPADALKMLRLADAEGAVRTDRLPENALKGPPGAAAKVLQSRLLVVADEVHTERGAHAKELITWDLWARRADAPPAFGDAAGARAVLEGIARRLSEEHGGSIPLPWQARSRFPRTRGPLPTPRSSSAARAQPRLRRRRREASA